MANIYNLNRSLENFLRSTRPKEYIKEEIKSILGTDLVKRIRPELLKQIYNYFPELISLNLTQKFEENKSEIGKTYGLFVNDVNGEGICLILKTNYDVKQNSELINFIGSAEYCKEEFNQAFIYVTKFIQEKLTDAYFYPYVQKFFGTKFLTPLNDIVTELKLRGNSIKLPFAVSILSVLLNKEVDSAFACSGNINENLQITYVDGMEEKISAALDEFPEIKKFVFPLECKNKLKDKTFNRVEIKFVENLDEALQIFFPDLNEYINKNSFIGKIGLIEREVELENGEKAIEFELNHDYSLPLDTIILRTFQTVFHKKVESKIKSRKVFLLNNFRPSWFVPSLMNSFVNKCKAVGVFYQNFDGYVIVYSENRNLYNLGDVIKLKTS